MQRFVINDWMTFLAIAWCPSSTVIQIGDAHNVLLIRERIAQGHVLEHLRVKFLGTIKAEYLGKDALGEAIKILQSKQEAEEFEGLKLVVEATFT